MRKFYLISFFLSVFVFGLSAQNWQIYDCSVLPSETGTGDVLDFTAISDDGPGAGMVTEIVLDPNIPGNKLFKYLNPDGKRTFRHDLPATYTRNAFTIVARLKGVNDPAYDRVMDIRWDNGNAGMRDELRMYYNGRLKLEKAGKDTYPDIDFKDWHIYRIQVIGDSASVFIDEIDTPVLGGKTSSTTTSKSLRFGDGSGDNIGGLVDWFIIDTTGAYTPSEQPLPASLTGQGNDEYVDWHVYTASVLPNQNIPAFEESNVAGTTYMNNIVDDPDIVGNKLLELVSSPAATNFMWKHNFPEANTNIVTVVARVKAVSDTVDRAIEIDLRHGGFRERLYINTNGTYELKHAGVKASLPEGYDPLAWHIYRLTKIDNNVVFYLDENPVPVNTVVTAEPATDNYFRFGDGNGSYEIGGYIDWVAWTTSGVYGPEDVGMPDTYVKSSDASLASLTSDQGSLVPDFSPEVTAYDLLLPATATSVNFTAAVSYAAASLSGDGELTPLPGVATITVTAEDGTTLDYVVTVTLDVLSSDANLASLAPSLGTLDPVFDPSVTNYTLVLPYGTAAVTFTATTSHVMASITGDGEFTTIPGTATITVTAEDGSTQDYTISVSLAAASSDASLSGLTTSLGSLNPAFDPGVTSYDLVLPAGSTSVVFTATANDANAGVAGDGEFTNIPGTATITVTAEDGSTQDYTISVSLDATGIGNHPAGMYSIYPNPASEILNVNAEPGTRIRIYNPIGEMVYDVVMNSSRSSIDVSSMNSGVYFMKFDNDSGVFVKRFIKK